MWSTGLVFMLRMFPLNVSSFKVKNNYSNYRTPEPLSHGAVVVVKKKYS